MENIKTGLPEIQADREIINSRIFSYPRRMLFTAWSHPQYLKTWWGPHGFTNTFEQFDFRPGGRWKFVMHGPEKGNYKNEVEFISILDQEHIYWKRNTQPLFCVAATFEEKDGQNTLLTFRMIFDTPEECMKLKKFVVDKNEENFDRLENVLEKMVMD